MWVNYNQKLTLKKPFWAEVDLVTNQGESQEERTCNRDSEIKSYSEISNNKFGFVTTKEISSPRYQKISMDLKMSFIWNSLKARLFKSFLSTYLCKMQMISGRLDQKTWPSCFKALQQESTTLTWCCVERWVTTVRLELLL